MSDMASTACGRRWPCTAPQRVVVQRPAQVRLPAFVGLSYELFGVCSVQMAWQGRARGPLARCAVGELDAGFAR